MKILELKRNCSYFVPIEDIMRYRCFQKNLLDWILENRKCLGNVFNQYGIESHTVVTGFCRVERFGAIYWRSQIKCRKRLDNYAVNSIECMGIQHGINGVNIVCLSIDNVKRLI